MSMTEKKARFRFKESGLKLTPQRAAIFSILEGNSSHPSAEDIHRELRRDYPNTSLATVYNTLESLKELDLIKEVTIDSERRHFDPDASSHHHVICVRCRRIEDVYEELPRVTRLPLSVRDEFRLLSYNVEFRALCKDCVQE
jgi:Fur family peroxide stress response transcriptional regulator